MDANFVLTVEDHDRSRLGLRYVYAVLSRRSGGLSIGVNLNPNNACNWRCVYCQVPGLQRGVAPQIDLGLLAAELRSVVREVMRGEFLQRHLPEGGGRFRDIAISGNGEPTTARELPEAVRAIGGVRQEFGVGPEVKTVLITNGTMMHRPWVQEALRALAALSGEVWFKVDAGTDAGLRRVHGVRWSVRQMRERLAVAAPLCPTWLQSCFFADDRGEPRPEEVEAYVGFVRQAVESGLPLAGVHLYTIARPPAQPSGAGLRPLPRAWLENLAMRLRVLGLPVNVAQN